MNRALALARRTVEARDRHDHDLGLEAPDVVRITTAEAEGLPAVDENGRCLECRRRPDRTLQVQFTLPQLEELAKKVETSLAYLRAYVGIPEGERELHTALEMEVWEVLPR